MPYAEGDVVDSDKAARRCLRVSVPRDIVVNVVVVVVEEEGQLHPDCRFVFRRDNMEL